MLSNKWYTMAVMYPQSIIHLGVCLYYMKYKNKVQHKNHPTIVYMPASEDFFLLYLILGVNRNRVHKLLFIN